MYYRAMVEFCHNLDSMGVAHDLPEVRRRIDELVEIIGKSIGERMRKTIDAEFVASKAPMN